MGDKIITLTQMAKWFDSLEESLKDRIVNSPIMGVEDRESTYHLYQAAQLLRARMLEDFSSEVEFKHNLYDEPN
jgi:hypothetical protein